MTTPTPYAVTQDDVQALIRVMENAGRAANASWFDVAHRVLQGLHSRNIVNYSIPRVDRDSVVQENARLQSVIDGLREQIRTGTILLNDLRAQATAATEALGSCTAELTAAQSGLSSCQTALELCQQSSGGGVLSAVKK